MSITVWASAPKTPLLICADGSAENDEKRGQLGWNFGIKYNDLTNLVSFLEGKGDKVSRLAICAHGASGRVDINGVFESNSTLTQSASNMSDGEWDAKVKKCLSVETFDAFKPHLIRIGNVMADNSVILFMSCNMASGSPGADLLKKLSADVWTRSKVVGFTRIGTRMGKIHLAMCDLPGMKFGQENQSPSTSAAQEDARVQALVNEPWADETNAVAKWAQKGVLGKDPDRVDWLKTLIGPWSLEAGDWTGIIKFDGSIADRKGKVWWANSWADKKHNGEWHIEATNTVVWQFDDDPKDWVRVWEVKMDDATVKGNVTINKAPHGFFRMWNTR